MRRKRKLGTIALGGLTPLLDTLFILLFALLALSDVRTANRTETVRIQLPEVEPGADPQDVEVRRVTVEITADSTVWMKGADAQLASRDDLDAALATLLGDAVPEEVLVEIHADRDSRHGVAVELLQHLRLRGFINVQLLAKGVVPGGSGFGGGR